MQKDPPPYPPGRRPDLTKGAAILAAAQHLFAANGFTATSMDAVARLAGTTKLTAYRHFGSKDALFAAAVTARCETMLADGAAETPTNDNPRAALIGFGQAFLRLILHSEALAIHRLIIAERVRAPQLGPIFLASAILPTKARLADLILALGLSVDDREIAATDLLALWRGKPMLAVEVGQPMWSEEELTTHVSRSVDLCIAGWRAVAAGVR